MTLSKLTSQGINKILEEEKKSYKLLMDDIIEDMASYTDVGHLSFEDELFRRCVEVGNRFITTLSHKIELEVRKKLIKDIQKLLTDSSNDENNYSKEDLWEDVYYKLQTLKQTKDKDRV